MTTTIKQSIVPEYISGKLEYRFKLQVARLYILKKKLSYYSHQKFTISYFYGSATNVKAKHSSFINLHPRFDSFVIK